MNTISNPIQSLLDNAQKPREPLFSSKDTQTGNPLLSYTINARNWFSYLLCGYTIQRFLSERADDVFEVVVESRSEFEVSNGGFVPVITKGVTVYSIEGFLLAYQADDEEHSHNFKARHDLRSFVSDLKEEVRLHNPLRCKHVQIQGGDQSEFRATIKPTPETTFESLIVDRRMAEDIYDNTIFQLKHTQFSNGVIFHGEPGTGKSLTCQAIIREATTEGFSTCYLVGEVNFSDLTVFIADFLAPCVVILEDIDSFAGEREKGEGRHLADFLQFLSGLSERTEQLIVIATTNHLQQLDKAINNRPVRFNRKYHFSRPTDAEVDSLLGLYFEADELPPNAQRLCHDRSFTGAHISEVRRTATTLATKRALPISAVFAEAVEVVAQHFSITSKTLGFGV
jgi:predicted AAA+ superfamily ATPase